MGTPSPYLRLVNVNNSGGELLQAEEGRRAVWPLIGAARSNPEVHGHAYHAISESGGVFFTAESPGGSGVLTIYARIHCAAGSSPSCKRRWERRIPRNRRRLQPVAVRVHGPGRDVREHARQQKNMTLEPKQVKEECQGFKPATFEGASADGSKVFFTTAQRLLNGDGDQTPISTSTTSRRGNTAKTH